MMGTNVKRLQARLAVNADGVIGPKTYTALFQKAGASIDRAQEMAIAANAKFTEAGLLDNELRLAHFMAQLIHESGSFRYMEEIASGKAYEGRADLGNTEPGDGVRFKGRGPIQITGRFNYRRFGRMIGIDLERHPEIAAFPSIGMLLAVAYWTDRGLNDLADRDDVVAITKKINGGMNGIDDRRSALAKMKALLL